MPLSNDQIEWLGELLARCEDEHERLNDWERKFTADQRERYEKDIANMWLSPKQLLALKRIEEKLG